MEFTNTSLWKRAFAKSNQGSANARLAEIYFKFWKNTCDLAERIQADLPNLTLHNKAHFEALWRRADQICGKQINLNPLELFVFGGGVLLHDLALTLTAYEGGKAGLQLTPQWADAASRHLTDANSADAQLNSDQEQQVLFETLRSLHAEMASQLCGLSFKSDDDKIYLLEDSELRTHLGELVGQVAASHHWDINRLEERFQKIIGSVAGYPEAWTIRPIVLACLLRCADAVQLDQSRAPDFVYAMIAPTGLSALHWKSQNKVAAPVVDPKDNSALLFSSTKPFEAKDAEAWWILHDALQVANAELQSTNSLLRDLGLPPFAISRVSKCESPRMLAQSLKLKGWHPVAARVQISNVRKVVEQFGGSQLYGNAPIVALRELIQNAADAIRLRRALEPNQYVGSITVRLTSNTRDGENKYCLSVEDDGLGMSESVLSGPLIDFGSSYITSSLVKIERPGLVGKRQKLTGKYGIGFFSIFMLGDQVDVVSRPYDRSHNETKTLKFTDGMKKQPLLLDEKPGDFSMVNSTRVSVAMSSERLLKLISIKSKKYDRFIELSLEELVGALAPSLEIDIWVEKEGSRTKVHDRKWLDGDDNHWLSQALFLNNSDVLLENEYERMHIEKFSHLLEPIDPENPWLGVAAIAVGAGSGVQTIGGLSTNSTSNDYMGFIEYNPGGPRRDIGAAVAQALLQNWATRQAKKLVNVELDDKEKYIAAVRVAKFGGDATPLACMLLNKKFVTLYTLVELLCGGEILFFPVARRGHDDSIEIKKFRSHQHGFLDHYDPEEVEFKASVVEPILEMNEGPYLCVPHERKSEPNSFFELLCRLVSANGYEVHGDIKREKNLAIYVGLSSEREGLLNGSQIESDCLKVTARLITEKQ